MSAFKYSRLDKTQAARLLVDHQAGLISLVQDFPPNEFKNNVLALAVVVNRAGLLTKWFGGRMMVEPHFSAGRAMLAPVHYDKSGPQPSILLKGASSKLSA